MATLQKRGKKWRAIVRKKGYRPVSKSFSTKARAETWARQIEGKIESRDFSNLGDLESITVADLIDRYIDEFDTKGTKLGSLNILKAGLGIYSLAELEPSHIVAHCRHRQRMGTSPATQSQDIGYLGEVLRLARAYWKTGYKGDPVGDAREILRRPMGGHPPLIGRATERDRRPTAAELEKLRNHWRGRPRQQIPMIDLVDFAIASGWRLGEICRVEWRDVNTQDRTILIRDRKDPRNKHGNTQEVPLLGDAWTIAMRQPNTDKRIFPYAAASVSTAFARACQRLGIEDLHFHDLRHDGISRMFEAGYQIPEVALCSGHRDWTMLRRYTQLKARDLHR